MKKLSILILILFLTNCSTKYQRFGLTGGYQEQQINENTFIVQFNGNGYTSQAKTEENLLRRCADLTKQNGFRYFIILNVKTDNIRQQLTNDSYSFTSNSNFNTNYYPTLSNSSTTGSTRGTIRRNPGIVTNIKIAQATIKMFKNKPKNPNQIVIDSDLILQKYQKNIEK